MSSATCGRQLDNRASGLPLGPYPNAASTRSISLCKFSRPVNPSEQSQRFVSFQGFVLRAEAKPDIHGFG
jgi:hypothetical protein